MVCDSPIDTPCLVEPLIPDIFSGSPPSTAAEYATAITAIQSQWMSHLMDMNLHRLHELYGLQNDSTLLEVAATKHIPNSARDQFLAQYNLDAKPEVSLPVLFSLKIFEPEDFQIFNNISVYFILL